MFGPIARVCHRCRHESEPPIRTCIRTVFLFGPPYIANEREWYSRPPRYHQHHHFDFNWQHFTIVFEQVVRPGELQSGHDNSIKPIYNSNILPLPRYNYRILSDWLYVQLGHTIPSLMGLRHQNKTVHYVIHKCSYSSICSTKIVEAPSAFWWWRTERRRHDVNAAEQNNNTN